MKYDTSSQTVQHTVPEVPEALASGSSIWLARTSSRSFLLLFINQDVAARFLLPVLPSGTTVLDCATDFRYSRDRLKGSAHVEQGFGGDFVIGAPANRPC